MFRPYADAETVFLHIGPDATPFSVHLTVLARSVVLAAKFDTWSMAKQHVTIPELNETTAHTLVHYLYTGKYQDLRMPSQIEKPAVANYKARTCVYCAAARYQLSGLAELAKEKITSFEDDVSIAEILAIARDHAFPLLPENETWYPTYLEDIIRSAMAKDPEPFRRPDFITQVEGNSRLLQVVWKTVMSNYATAPGVPKADDNEPTSTTETALEEIIEEPQKAEEAEEAEEAAPVDAINSKSADESQTAVTTNKTLSESPIPEPSQEVTTAAKPSFEDTLKLEDIEPTVEAPQAPEPYTDELGFEKSKMYQKMGKNNVGPEQQVVAKSDPERPAHKRSDSVIQVEEAATTPLEEADEAEKVDAASPLVVNGSSETVTPSKKSKKTKKKKSAIVF